MSYSDTRNRVQLIGHLGGDVDLKVLPTGLKIAKFSIATTDYYRNPKGEKVSKSFRTQMMIPMSF